MSKILSRATEVNIEKCVENVDGNRFNMVLIAAARSREISKRSRDTAPEVHSNSCVDALLEIQESKIGVEYLRKVK